jgi:hypothetical protein
MEAQDDEDEDSSSSSSEGNNSNHLIQKLKEAIETLKTLDALNGKKNIQRLLAHHSQRRFMIHDYLSSIAQQSTRAIELYHSIQKKIVQEREEEDSDDEVNPHDLSSEMVKGEKPWSSEEILDEMEELVPLVNQLYDEILRKMKER